MSQTPNDTTPKRSLDFDQVLQEVRLPLRLTDAAIVAVAEVGAGAPVERLLRANEYFGDDLWSAVEGALFGLRQLSKAHDEGCSRMMETGNLVSFRSAMALYLGTDASETLTNGEVKVCTSQGMDLIMGRSKTETSLEPLRRSCDHLLVVIRGRLRSGSAVAQIEQARTLIEEAITTEEAVRNLPKPTPVPARTALDVIADGAAAAFERGDSEEEYLAAVPPDPDSEEIDETMCRYRDQLIEQGRWPWRKVSPEDNGSARPVPVETEEAKKLARFDHLVADLPAERKIALLERLEGTLAIGGRIRRAPEQDLEGDEELRELLRNDPGGALRALLPAFFAADDERHRHLIALAGDVLCRDHDRRYRKSCPFCGVSMTDISISRGACGNCWRMRCCGRTDEPDHPDPGRNLRAGLEFRTCRQLGIL